MSRFFTTNRIHGKLLKSSQKIFVIQLQPEGSDVQGRLRTRCLTTTPSVSLGRKKVLLWLTASYCCTTACSTNTPAVLKVRECRHCALLVIKSESVPPKRHSWVKDHESTPITWLSHSFTRCLTSFPQSLCDDDTDEEDYKDDDDVIN